jgi:hypothetical protein
MDNFIKNFKWSKAYTVGSVMLGVLLLISMTLGINNNGFRTVVQWPNGNTFIKFNAGMYITLFGTTTEYPDVVTHELNGSGISVRYQDGGTGSVDGVVRVALPTDAPSMLTLHRGVRSVEGFKNKLLIPEIKQSLNLTAGLMTSEEAYAVRRNDYATWAGDQLSNGRYWTELTAKTVKTTEGKTQTKNVPTIKMNQETGMPMHQSSPFNDYGLVVAGFQITDWDFEEKTLRQISDKRAAEMAIITARANADKAVWQQKEIKANGLREVERVRYEQLQLKEKATIEASRKKEVAVIGAELVKEVNSQKEMAAIIDVRTAKQEASATKTRADAEAYAKKAVIMADGALDKKLATIEKIQAVWADAYSKRNVPSVVMGGGSEAANGDANAFMKLLTTKAAKDLALDMKISK